MFDVYLYWESCMILWLEMLRALQRANICNGLTDKMKNIFDKCENRVVTDVKNMVSNC
jgi:hypothetical protein